MRGEERVFGAVPAQRDAPAAGQAVYGVEDLIPAVVWQKDDERIQPDHGLFFEVAEMKASIQAAGLLLEEVIQRDPYPDVEAATQRAYIFARKPE